jgi:tRNA pseudouridine55 synthase
VILLDKPIGLSSNDALQKVKRLFRAVKAGHTGTLDPLATGVLPLCFGAATKFSQIHLDADKHYVAVAQLGVKTSTGDAEGTVVSRREVLLSADRLSKAQHQFTGKILQTPPMHSALKKDGRALYTYARAGIEVERTSRAVDIKSLSLQKLPDASDFTDRIQLEVTCSKGTYIRVLAEDIGEALGCGAHLVSLRRTGTGPFKQDQALALAQLEAMTERERDARLLPIEAILGGYTQVTLAPNDAGRFLHGIRQRGAWPDCAKVAVFGTAPPALLGSGHVKAGELIPGRLLSPIEIQQILETSS